ncbi:hypothetical protein H6F53_04515 [Trichocoleus sp. FACHB-832]|uniref:hypothetical protein n=1 Tax=Trichocoleus sp. FACHB-832 TaxID=2692875 RepID=UPI001687D09F|nr:hypothetical protein [Trichocoleus sp. FACHB-832]MBD1904756.1 hypothetical protein [Trichocoleus sp. FACHB-832]
MAEIQDTHPHNNLPNGETTSQEPLGFKNPLLPANPLGQNFISRKFLYPLGARAITAFDPSVFFSREMPDEVPPDNPFDNSPFFAESQASQLSKSVAASDGITSAAAPPVVAQLKESTLIQPRLETEKPVLRAEVIKPVTAPQVTYKINQGKEDNSALLSSTTALSETLPPTITEVTQIQPRLESKISTDNPEVSQSITAPQVASIVEEKQEFDAATTQQVRIIDGTQIQPQLESRISTENSEVIQSITAPQVASIVEEKQELDTAIVPQITTAEATQIQPRLESKTPNTTEAIEPGITRQETLAVPKAAEEITDSQSEFAALASVTKSEETPQVTITDVAQIQPRLESKISSDNPEVAQSIAALEVASITQEKQGFDPTTTPPATVTDATIVQAFKESNPQPGSREVFEPITSPEVASITQEKQEFDPTKTPQVTITDATQIQPRLESQISTDNTEKIESVAAPQVADEVTQEKQDFAPAITPQVTITDASQVQTFKETERPTIKTEGIESVAAPQVADEVTQEKQDFAPRITPQVTSADAIERQISAENTEEIESGTVTSPQVVEEVTQEKEEFAPATTPEVTITDATVQPRLESKISDENIEEVESGTAPQVNYLTTQQKEEFAPATTPEVTITDATVQPRLESKISVKNTEGIESIAAPEVADEVTQQKKEFAPATTPEVTITDAAQVQAFKETPTTKAGGIESEIALQVASEATQEKEAFASVTTPEVTTRDTTVQPRLESKILPTKTEGIESGTLPQGASKVNEAQSEFGALASVTMPEETPQVTTTNSIQVQAQLETQTPATTEGIEQKTTPEAAPLPPQPAAGQTIEVAALSNVTEPMPFSVSRKVESVEIPAIASEKTLTQSDITAPSLASSVTTPDVPLVQLLSEQEPRKATEEAVSEINAPSSVAPLPTQLHENLALRVEEAIAPISSDTSNKQVSKITANTEMGVVQPLLDNQLSAQYQVPTAREDLADKVEGAAPISSATDNKQVSESTPNTQANIIQPLGETEPRQQIEEIPQLPTVLTNLSILSPLTQSNLLVSKFPEQTTLNVEESLLSPSKLPSRIQKMPEEGDKGQGFGDSEVKPPSIQRSVSSSFEEEKLRSQQAGDLPESNQSSIPLAKDSAIAKTIPTSWSSIADLIGETTSDSSNSMIVQPLLEERGWQEPIISSSDSRNSYSTVDSPHTDRANGVIQAYSNTSGRTSASGMEALRQLMESSGGSKVEAHQSDEDFSEDEGVDNLEILAREIYSFIKQRLEIERERRGNNYSGRLPW